MIGWSQLIFRGQLPWWSIDVSAHNLEILHAISFCTFERPSKVQSTIVSSSLKPVVKCQRFVNWSFAGFNDQSTLLLPPQWFTRSVFYRRNTKRTFRSWHFARCWSGRFRNWKSSETSLLPFAHLCAAEAWKCSSQTGGCSPWLREVNNSFFPPFFFIQTATASRRTTFA